MFNILFCSLPVLLSEFIHYETRNSIASEPDVECVPIFQWVNGQGVKKQDDK